MRAAFIAAVAVALSASTSSAFDKIDKRLASVTKAFVVAADNLSDDQPISKCVAERLPSKTPLQIVTQRDSADIVLTVSDGHVGTHPRAKIEAALPDGTRLWDGKTKKRGMNLLHLSAACTLAGDLVDGLRDAMRKARNQK